MPPNNQNKQLQKSKKGKKNHARNSPEAQFQREWERVQQFKKKNTKLRLEITALVDKVTEQVRAIETQNMQCAYEKAMHLVGFVGKKSLSDADREELLDWIESQLMYLQSNLFVPPMDVQAITESLLNNLQDVDNHRRTKLIKKMQQKGAPQELIDELKDAHDKINNFFDEAHNSESRESLEAKARAFFDEFLADFELPFEDEQDEAEAQFWQAHEDLLKQKDAELDQLLKATPLQQLFRKIAACIHPDRERDPRKKTQRHEQMAKLLAARDERDIPTLISLYIEHIGEMPAGFFNGNFDKMTRLLKHQVEQLQAEKEHIIAEIPAGEFVYHTFAGKNDAEVNKNIRSYIRALSETVKHHQSFITSVKTLDDLRRCLRMRAQVLYEQEMEGLFD